MSTNNLLPFGKHYLIVESVFTNGMKITIRLRPLAKGYAVLAHFQFNTGTRVGEACALDWQDIDLNAGLVRISKSVQWARGKNRTTVISELTKTGKTRVIPLLDMVKDILVKWQTYSRRATGLVFSQNGFKLLEYRSVQYRYDKSFKAVGLNASASHILRHSFSTDFQLKTQDQFALSKILGHKNLKQTEHYAKITNETMQIGLRSYNEALQEKE